MSKLTIGQLATLKQISVQTLRYYDKIGLLVPQYVNKETKYRYYDISQCAKLDLILYLKQMGFQLSYIQKQMEIEDIDLALKTSTKQLEIIKNKIIELNDLKSSIETCITNYNNNLKFINLSESTRVIKEHFPQRNIFYYQPVIPGESQEAFHQNLWNLQRLADMRQIKVFSQYQFCLLFPKESVEDNTFVASKIGYFLNGQPKFEDNVENIPEGDFLCTYFENYIEEKKNRQVLLKYLNDNNLQIAGYYIWEVVADLPVFIKGERKLLFRSQVYIR